MSELILLLTSLTDTAALFSSGGDGGGEGGAGGGGGAAISITTTLMTVVLTPAATRLMLSADTKVVALVPMFEMRVDTLFTSAEDGVVTTKDTFTPLWRR